MSPADVAVLVLLGIVAGFPIWFPAGWLARRDENRELLRARAARDRRRPRPARPLPQPRPARAERADRGDPAPLPGTNGTGHREVTR